MADIEKKPTIPGAVPDAGNRHLDHYKYRLPKFRYKLRQKILPLIRWETPYLAYVQEHVRTPALDSYFAITANLGTHTFFMVMLPILFWFGYTSLGRAMVHILAAGVFFSGFVKDLLCLPRPLSPPLHRITMSGSAALEYGFPSTHSTNAVSVALYALAALKNEHDMDPAWRLGLELLAYTYAISIVVGRIYCGMHGFSDVIVGSLLGALLAWVQWDYRREIDVFIYSGDWAVPVIVTVAIIILVRIHPEPADSCPCFDDGVAFSGVVIGADVGHWHYAHSSFSWKLPVPATVPYSYQELGIVKSVVIIFAWREVMKPTLHSILPPVYRFMERIGLSLPRKDYKLASQYTKVPRLQDDTLPPLQEIPALIHNIRRTRSDSVGPQSAADAYETLAYREKKRRESIGSGNAPASPLAPAPDFNPTTTNGYSPTFPPNTNGATPIQNGTTADTKPTQHNPEMCTSSSSFSSSALLFPSLEDVQAEAEMFMRIERPRVRYDVEVVTKLIVYSGIAWLAVEGNPIIFELVGLGMGGR